MRLSGAFTAPFEGETDWGVVVKSALVYMDEGGLKIVYGTSVKVIKPTEMSLDYNVSFLDKLFSNYKVYVIESASLIQRDKLAELASAGPQPAKAAEQALDTEPEDELPPAQPAPVIKGGKTAKPRAIRGPVFIKSNAKMTIIVDDLFTGDQIKDTGMRKALVVTPDLPVNLSILDQEMVKKSAILRRLIENGTFTPITVAEALEYEAAAKAKKDAEDDAETEHSSRIIDSSESGSAKKYAQGMKSGSGRRVDEADEIDLTEDIANAGRRRPGGLPNEDTDTMSSLMDMIGQAEAGEPAQEESGDEVLAVAEEPRAKAKLEERPRREVDPGKRARGIRGVGRE